MTTEGNTTRHRKGIAAFMLLALAAVASIVPHQPTQAAVSDHDWLGVVNTYRAMSGLSPVTENPAWTQGARNHSCYMLQNGISHDEIPGKPGYTDSGDVAGNSGNVAVSSSINATPRDHIDLWMTGPFHAIGIMRQNLAQSAFGGCAQQDTPTPWRSGGTLDVLRGLKSGPKQTSPIVFPGHNSTTPLYRFVAEYPNPVELCGWSGTAGLPLFAMMSKDFNWANASLTGPDGAPLETCTLHKGNVSHASARAILDYDDAVIIVPRSPLTNGRYAASVQTASGNVDWSFTVDREAALSAATPTPTTVAPQPAEVLNTRPTASPTKFSPMTPYRLADTRTSNTRLQPHTPLQIDTGRGDATAVSMNLTAVNPSSGGWIKVFPCNAAEPTVSSVNFAAHRTVANQATAPIVGGSFCVVSNTSTDVVIDVNGFYHPGGTGSFVSQVPYRLVDSRQTRAPLQPGVERRVRVTGVPGGAPHNASAVLMNVTAVTPHGNGYLQVYPCGSSPFVSTINYVPGVTRPNLAVVKVGTDGAVCLKSTIYTEFIIDLSGYIVDTGAQQFTALSPIRLTDTRERDSRLNPMTGGQRLGAHQTLRIKVAGTRGIPATTRAVSFNLTAADPASNTYLTAFPCGARPTASNVNLATDQGGAAATAVVSKLSEVGEICIYTPVAVHVIVDVNGAWH